MALINTDWTKELEQVNTSLSTLFEEKIEPMVDRVIENATQGLGATLKGAVADASENVGKHIDSISEEINKQRYMTKQDVESLIDYAAAKFGAALDERIDKAKVETAKLVTEKLNEVRGQLTEAATQQKKSALRNATIAVIAAILVAGLSLIYNKVLHGDIDLLVVFRASLLALAAGNFVILVVGVLNNYIRSSRDKRNLVIVGVQFIGAFKTKHLIAHIMIFFITFALWGALSYWSQMNELFVAAKLSLIH